MRDSTIRLFPIFVSLGLASCSGGEGPSKSSPGAEAGSIATSTAGWTSSAGNTSGSAGASGTNANTGGAGALATGGSSGLGTGGSSGSSGLGTGGSTPVGGGAGALTGGQGQGGAAGTPASGGGAGGATPICPAAPTLKEAATCRDRLIGVALTNRHLGESAYANNAKEFNYVTAEDEMKWNATEPSRGQFSFAAGDQIVDFAKANGMKVKGHTLVWYNQLPPWVSSINDANELRSVMVNHVQKVMAHYKGQVSAWDVVNEAWDPSAPTTLRDSVFTRVLGPSYIDDAFKAAREADPDATLYYNDYGTDGLSTKANSVYAMVKSMKERGIPIDGVGLQMHWRSVGSTLTAGEMVENIQRLAALGLEVVISEMDVQLCKGGTLEDQKQRFHDIVAGCVSQPACKAVTFWGITDKYSWLNDLSLGCTGTEKPRGLLWDDGYVKKPAYTGVMDALRGL